MKWFTGDVSLAIQKAINEKKVFIVFVKDENDNSQKMEDILNDEQIAEVCCEEKCVAINILANSVPGQQFSAIFPVLCLPSTYLINNQGTPTDIIPGVLEKEEFTKRLKDAIEKTLEPLNTVSQDLAPTDDKSENKLDNEQPSTSSYETSSQDSGIAPKDVDNTDIECSIGEGKGGNDSGQQGSSEVLDDDLESELTAQEKSQIEMLREKVKLKREEEEKQKSKEMEKKRVETGRELQMAQRQVAERQATQLAKEIADRKAEEKAAREKVREQIRQDRVEKTKRFDKEKKEREELRKKVESTPTQSEKRKAETSTTARVQFRLPDGSSVSNQFNAEAKFLVAESFIKDHVQLPNIRLTTVYPKHEFDSEDALKSFRELGLVPNASIIVSPGSSTTSSKTTSSSSSSLDPISFIMFVLAPIFSLFNWIASFFTGNTNNESQSNQSTTPYPSSSRDDSVRRRNVHTDSRNNIQRLRRDDDDENATWNGNSTQQM